MPEVRSGSVAPMNRKESISMLLKLNSKLSFIPICASQTCSASVKQGSSKSTLLQQQSAQILCWHDRSWPSILCSTGCWLQKEWSETQWECAGEQGKEMNPGADTKLTFIQHWAVPLAKSSDTRSHNKFPLCTQTQKKCVLMFKGDWGSRNWGVETEAHWVTCMDKQIQECTGKAKGPSEQMPARVKHSATLSCS